MTNFVSWDCDAFDLTNYTADGLASISASTVHAGSGSMLIAFSGASQGQTGYKYDLGGLPGTTVTLGSRWVHRWWMKVDSGLVWSNQNKVKASRWSDGNVTTLTGYITDGGIQIAEHGTDMGFSSDQGAGSGGDGPSISYDFDPTTNADIQNWQEYILDHKIHSSEGAGDGYLKFYVNGSLIGSITGINWWTQAALNANHPTASDPYAPDWRWGVFMMAPLPQNMDGNIWFDDFSLDDTWNSSAYSSPEGVALGSMRIRKDDGSQSGASWKQSADTLTSFASDTNFRLRAIIKNNTGASATHKYRLEYRLTGAWTPVGSGAVQMAASGNITDGEATTAQLTAPAGMSFTAGKAWDVSNGTTSITLTNGQYTELEWCCSFASGQTSPNQNYKFRVTRS